MHNEVKPHRSGKIEGASLQRKFPEISQPAKLAVEFKGGNIPVSKLDCKYLKLFNFVQKFQF